MKTKTFVDYRPIDVSILNPTPEKSILNTDTIDVELQS